MAAPDPVAERLLDAALDLAERGSWEAVRLRAVAERAGVGLDELGRHFREKEDLAERWFDRADRAMLAAARTAEFSALDSTARLHRLMMIWFGVLAAHRRVTREMILNKLEPGHLHVQLPGLLRISRTVQWVREAAGRDATFLHRAVEETVLTSIYLAAFARWMFDSSPGSAGTDAFLMMLLRRAGCLERGILGREPVAPRGPVV